MASTEGFSSGWLVFLDAHLRVTESDNLDLRARLDIDSRLLGGTRCPERLVERDLLALVGSHYFL